MTFKDWAHDTARRYRNESVGAATAESTRRLARGAARRAQPATRRAIPIVWERGNWDVLVILDACRVDLMREVAPEYGGLGDVDAVWSQGSTSIDWIDATFNHAGRDLSDVAYVTANPFTDHDGEDARSADLKDHATLGHLRPLYETEWREVGGIETVPPEWVTNHAVDTWRRRDELGVDRMVVHYMQPHEPYITRPSWSNQNPNDNAVLKNLVDDDYEAGTSPWRAMVETGNVSVLDFWEVYKDNLRWVLNDTVERLLPNLDADVAISADHGNGLGEYGVWHHPPGTFSPYVRKVPWLEVEAEDYRTLDPHINSAVAGSDDLEERLEALGYKR